MNELLWFSPEAEAARRENRPLVALESTIITHGMPFPQNLEMAHKVEQIIRNHDVCPATIAIMDGRICIGLTDEQLKRLANTPDARKLSRADLAECLVTGQTGATTVAATMICARLAGIDVFATGGIGGVHRGGEQSFDISADLQELAKTRVTVVAAGAKAILDIPKTLEVLETLGVAVFAYGQDRFPAFWSRDSGLAAPLRADDPEIIAKAHMMRGQLGLAGGQLVGNPVPEDSEIPADVITPMIEAALSEAVAKQISAKAVTPFLLDRIFELSKGASLATNIALVENNAQLAAKIARHL